MSLTTPPSVKDWYSNDNDYPITPGGVYMICLFYEDMDQGGPLFAMAGSDATSTPPPDVLRPGRAAQGRRAVRRDRRLRR